MSLRQQFLKCPGTKRFLVRHYVDLFRMVLGAFRLDRKVHWRRDRRLVFICSGNVCRSPYAEYYARSRGLTAVSAGIDTVDGKAANPTAGVAAISRGIDLTGHGASELLKMPLMPDDILIVMEPAQLDLVKKSLPDSTVTLLGLWSCPMMPYIADPFGLPEEFFGVIFSIIDSAVDNIAALSKEPSLG